MKYAINKYINIHFFYISPSLLGVVYVIRFFLTGTMKEMDNSSVRKITGHDLGSNATAAQSLSPPVSLW